MARRRVRQQEIQFRRHGGARRGAGRSPTGERALVSHQPRAEVSAREPVLVTLKVRREIWNLRSRRALTSLLPALVAAREGRLRLVHFSVQRDHIHLIVEANHKSVLARGVQGLAVRIARALNRLMGRAGRVFKDRYHARVLGTPRQVRNALAYVLGNARKHGVALPSRGLDPCSSASVFDGWAGRIITSSHELARVAASAVVDATSWLLRVGWRRGGDLLDPDHRPGPLPA